MAGDDAAGLMKSKFENSEGQNLAETGERFGRDGKAHSNHQLKVDRILVPVDFSDCSRRALEYALAVARKFGSTLVLLHVIEPSSGGGRLASRFGASAQEGLDKARERLVELCREHIGAGFVFETLVRMGLAHSEISDTAKALACDLIIMGTRGRTAPQSAMGSTADWVVHHAYCPVLTLRPC
jgi:nucleotide-binding universal stress UspA family protein